jgi:hypothetical protein
MGYPLRFTIACKEGLWSVVGYRGPLLVLISLEKFTRPKFARDACKEMKALQ